MAVLKVTTAALATGFLAGQGIGGVLEFLPVTAGIVLIYGFLATRKGVDQG